ncbi:MAG: 3-oxoacyl-[acyl-carrier-protein] synthase 2 [Chlamydiia bacterium]|nr:3-oxoacyl-[acyl-carrier-protein] synthase 2 [Chlamydiia bacterium]
MSKEKKRIVVTGIGIVSCLGTDSETVFDALCNGKSGISQIEELEGKGLPVTFGGKVRGFDASQYVDRKTLKNFDTCTGFGLAASKMALEDALLDIEAMELLDLERFGCVCSAGMGGMGAFIEGVFRCEERGVLKVSPYFVPAMITNMTSGIIAIRHGLKGPNYSVSTACSTSGYSIYHAAKHIQNGEADIMIAGGIESTLNVQAYAGFLACKALASPRDDVTETSRPFDAERSGFVMAEGACVLILEELEHAKKRGAKIYAEYLGGAINCDAFHITAPCSDGAGLAGCMELALKDANLKATDIDYVNPHATATSMGDAAECHAIKKVFGDCLDQIKVSATKSMMGHSLGATSAVEAVVTIETIRKNKVHPTLNLLDPAPEAEGIDLVPGDKAIDWDVKIAMSNSLGFGGHNVSLIFGEYA